MIHAHFIDLQEQSQVFAILWIIIQEYNRHCHEMWGYSFYQMLQKPDNIACNYLTVLQLGEWAIVSTG